MVVVVSYRQCFDGVQLSFDSVLGISPVLTEKPA
jgi:hypothetical protein